MKKAIDNSQTGLPSSIRPRVPLRRGQSLTIKRHCDGALKQVVGYFEHVALKDPTGKRFVFAGWEAALRGINKHYKMSRRTFFEGQAIARAHHIISKPLQRVRGGNRYTGSFVTHPEALCVREGAESVFKGKTPKPPVGNWKEETGVVFWHGRGTRYGSERRSEVALASHQLRIDKALPAHQLRTAPALENRKARTESRTDTLSSKMPDTRPASHNSSNSYTKSSVPTAVQETPSSEDALQSILQPLNLLVSQSSETIETSESFEMSDTTGDQGQEQTQPQDQNTEGVSTSRLTDQKPEPAPMKIKGETIGDHFALGVSVEQITDGEFDIKATDWSEGEWNQFLGCMKEAVAAKDHIHFPDV